MLEFAKHWAAAFAAAGAFFLILDMIWLRFAVPMLYRPLIGDALGDKFRAAPAAIFYVIYFTVLALFAVLPGFFSQAVPGFPLAGVPLAVVFGALVGLTGYGTYNLTNMATLKNWPSQMALVDMAWGVVSSGLAAGAATLLLIKLWAA